MMPKDPVKETTEQRTSRTVTSREQRAETQKLRQQEKTYWRSGIMYAHYRIY